jgi:hypothetical protein
MVQDKRIMKIKTTPSKIKDRNNSRAQLLQTVSKSISQKNFILIRPTPIV